LRASRRMEARSHPSRLARRGSHLRMTAEPPARAALRGRFAALMRVSAFSSEVTPVRAKKRVKTKAPAAIKSRKGRSRAFPKRTCVGTYRSHPTAYARVAFSGSPYGPDPRLWRWPDRFPDFGEGAQWFIAGWSSPVARQAHNLKVTGSNPVPATKIDTENPAISGLPGFCF
jgi:hypothetical protein